MMEDTIIRGAIRADHAGVVEIYREVGYKFDRYWDVSWYEREVGK